MAIKATFLTGKNETQTDSLYQWDYGQVLEIESAVLSSNTVEVHFACTNMSEAIVRVCTFSADGVLTVAIPDDCLEQSSLITAWIYEIAGTQGRTSKVIRIPVVARTRPSVGRDIPTDISDRYTELMTAVNEAVEDLKNGNVMVKNAQTAVTANSATTAGNASTANYAVSADSANKALRDADGIGLKHLLHCSEDAYIPYENGGDAEETRILGGVIAFKITRNGSDSSPAIRILTEVGDHKPNCSAIFYDEISGKESGVCPMRLVFTPVSGYPGEYHVKIQALNADRAWFDATYSIYPVSIEFQHFIKYAAG